ncbi:hypothetical protein RTP6_003513 [Batrachochytrium dendrobatidis]
MSEQQRETSSCLIKASQNCPCMLCILMGVQMVTDSLDYLSRMMEEPSNSLEFYLNPLTSKFPLSDAVKSLVDQTVNAFKELPMEEPKGGSDVYRMDTTIIVDAPNFQWRNTPNQGCSYVPSSVIPTDDQKAAFTLFVERINKLADEHAVVEGGLTC